MANHAKLREQARVLETKENWREAIAVYRQLIENPEGEVDIGLWNRIGDLHVRLSETDKAVDSYESAVDAYAEVGLHNNAIALCRKVLRLVPGRASVYLKLGQISAAKGFLADARQNFLEYAERMQRAGKSEAAFTALKEFADLSPDDTDVRRVLADQLLSHGRTEEGIEQLRILVGLAEEKGADAVAEELRDRIRSVDPEASTEGLVRAAAEAGEDDFRAAFHTGSLSLDPSPAAADAPAGLQPTGLDAGELTLGEITPLAGLETTHLDEPPAPPPAPADEAEAALGELRIEPLDAPMGDEPAFEAPPAHDVGEAVEDAEEADALPLMDLDDWGSPPAEILSVAPLEGLETRHDFPDAAGGEEEASPEDEPLPLMDFSTEPEPVGLPEPEPPARDALEGLRERFAAAPEDARVRGDLMELLAERGLGHEREELLDGAHRALGARGMYPEALSVVADLLALRPGDGALLQKQVEYAFRSGDRLRLVPAYLALGQHLLAGDEQAKGQAVFRRVLELDPENEKAREVLEAAAQSPAAPEPGKAAPAGPGDDYIDLGSLIMGDEPQQGGTRFVVEEKEPTGDEDRDFAEMLAHFRQKVSENIDVEDSASHYDLGLAFKEMGLLDEAIAELQVALRGGANPLATLELLGQCFVEKGQFAVAARVLDRALRITGASEAELIGVLYQLGRTEEAMGDPAKARDYYERVLSIDIRFRDAQRRAESLRAASGA